MKQDCDEVVSYCLKCKILSTRCLQYLQYFTGRGYPERLLRENLSQVIVDENLIEESVVISGSIFRDWDYVARDF